MIPFAKWLAAQPGHPTRAAYPIVDDPFADPPVTTAEKYLHQHGVQTVYANFKKPYSATIGTRGLEAAAQDGGKDASRHGLPRLDRGRHGAGVHVGAPASEPTPKYFIASSGPDQGTSFLSAVGTGAAVGAMVPNGWFGGFPNALSHVMVQTTSPSTAVPRPTSTPTWPSPTAAGQVEAAAVQPPAR